MHKWYAKIHSTREDSTISFCFWRNEIHNEERILNYAKMSWPSNEVFTLNEERVFVLFGSYEISMVVIMEVSLDNCFQLGALEPDSTLSMIFGVNLWAGLGKTEENEKNY